MIELKRDSWVISLGIFCIALLLFTLTTSHQEIIGFEARFYLFALEMWRHGASFFPTAYLKPYPDYPATSTLLIVGAAKIAGHLSKFIAVFPSAVAASLTVMLTYWIGALRDPRWGWGAVFFLLLTNTFVMEARTISPDQYIVLVTTLCFYLVYSADVFQKSKRLWCVPLLFLVGFAFRGPIGLIVPAAVISVYYLLDRKLKAFVINALVAALMLLIGCGVLFGLAYQVGGMAFVNDVLQLEVVGRLQEAYLPWYFYFVESLGAYAITYPLALLIVLGLTRECWRKQLSTDMQFIQKLVGWALVILIGLTIPAGKKVRYIMAISPALALISAYLFVMPIRQVYFKYLRKGVYGLCCAMPYGCFLVTLVAGTVALEKQFFLPVNYALLITLFLCLQTIAVINIKHKLRVLAVAAFAFIALNIWIVEPVNVALNRTREFVLQVEVERQQEKASLVFYQENPDGIPIKYMANMPRESIPRFISEPSELLQIKPRMMVITSKENYANIPATIVSGFHIVSVGAIGHEPVVVLERKH